MNTKDLVREALAKSPLFGCCDPGRVEFTLKRLKKGSRAPNTPGGELAAGLIVRGRVQVYSVCGDGTTVNLSALKPGDCFGVSNLFSEDEMETLLICDTNTAVAYISKSHFMSLFAEYTDMPMRYACLCNAKIGFLIRKISLLTMPSCKARLAGWLLKNSGGSSVPLEMSKEKLAGVLGVSRASLFRELKRLGDCGIIKTEGRTVLMLDPARLERLALGGE